MATMKLNDNNQMRNNKQEWYTHIIPNAVQIYVIW